MSSNNNYGRIRESYTCSMLVGYIFIVTHNE
jgi:hypothetical protein